MPVPVGRVLEYQPAKETQMLKFTKTTDLIPTYQSKGYLDCEYVVWTADRENWNVTVYQYSILDMVREGFATAVAAKNWANLQNSYLDGIE